MKSEMIIILSIFFGFALLEMRFTNFFRKPEAKNGDWIVELVSTLALTAFTQPLIVLSLSPALGATSYRNIQISLHHGLSGRYLVCF